MSRQEGAVLHHVDRSFWKHVEMMDDGRMGCKFCGHLFPIHTSISRIKIHLAGLTGRGVRICGQVPQDVQDAALAAIDGPPEKKLKTGAGSSNNEVTNAISALAQQQNNEMMMAHQREDLSLEDCMASITDEDEELLVIGNFHKRPSINQADEPHADRSFWKHVEKMDDGHMVCKYCGNGFAKDTSKTRIKNHLARVKGRGVRICGKVPQDVQEAALAAIDGPPEKKLKTGAGSSNNEVTHPPKNLFCPGLESYSDQLCSSSVKHHVDMDEVKSIVKEKTEHDVIMDEVKSVVKEKTEHDVIMDDVKNVVKEKTEHEVIMDDVKSVVKEKIEHDVIMDDVKNVVKVKTEPIASMLEQSNAIVHKLSGDDGRIQVGVHGLEQGAEDELICLHPEAESGMENTCAEFQHVDINDSLGQTRLMESTSGGFVQPGTSASSTKLVGRAYVKNAIWSCLMNDKVSIIGIYGMGGNGKTTMLRNICNELLERQDISHSIYWVNVPQDFRIDTSQDLIAKRLLDLNLSSKDDDLCGVVELAKELMMKQKWILILNDLWNSFDPQQLEIPIPLNGSKFIMTTRSKMVCQQMNCQNSIRVDPLPDEEAWTLFMKQLGHERQLSVEEQRIAVDAVRECAGLPLGIVTLAESLKGVHDLHKWKITLKRLKESNFWDMEDQIFKTLRLSYDCLDDSAKQCFVYCALFDESHKIERRELIKSFIEEGIIKEKSAPAAFDKGHSILDGLENVCLLERIDDGSAIKMHDLLRDMAIQILDDEYSLDMRAEEERG